MIDKAPFIYKCKGYGHFDTWCEDEKELDAKPSHRAKLTCVEEIKYRSIFSDMADLNKDTELGRL